MQATKASVLLAGLAPGAQLGAQEISLVTTDSRRIEPGCVFVAFPGEHFDGHAFAAEAVRRGAAFAVVNHPVEGLDPARAVLCPDSYRAMLAIGANYRAQFAPQIVGVTGSVGKTTTKEFCYSVLSAFGQTIKTEGNQNNELGLPNTLLRLSAQTQYAAVEMGMSHLHEIERLSRCARPAAGIITCIGVSHLENLGTRENILRAKLEICAGLPAGAPLALNGDDPYLRGAALPGGVRPAWYALDAADADVRAAGIRTQGDSTCFTLEDRAHGRFPVEIPIIGRHNIYDALAAYTAATRLGLDPARAAAALADFRQTGLRQHVVHHAGITVIEDCYNANPDSMRAALEMFRTYPAQRRFALLGDMLELGAVSEQAHAEVGRQAAQCGLTTLVTCGARAQGTADAAEAAGLPTVRTDSCRQAADVLLRLLRPGDALLVKASRGMALENSLKLFYAEYPSAVPQ
jgi:UDP-N-acetylmuramoyl-tripeptide--D-alanyl-D-alanine ligase